MKPLRVVPLVVGLSFAGVAFGSKPPAASKLIDGALHAARAKHKGVLVIFHASWCGWCKQLDKTLDMPVMKAVMDKDFVILHVTVLENDAHKADENPGGAELMAKMGGTNAGLPYFTMLDYKGKQVGDSMVVEGNVQKPQNMGFPTETVEISHFMEMLKSGNPNLNSEDAAAVEKIMDSRAAEIKATQSH